MSVWVVVGGQYGSEGKGKISALITLQEKIDLCIRCGGPNSGHSFQRPDGGMVTLRQLPTGFVRPETRLLIPAGGLIDIDVLKAEVDALALDRRRVGIDRNAMIISGLDRHREKALHLEERLSSTLCGVGSAVARRALREEGVELASDFAGRASWFSPLLTGVSEEVNAAVDSGRKVLIEGTQGAGLSLYHSPFYPRVTSRDTNAAGFLSEVGISPRAVTEIVLVFRTFPIRVSGSQAGPLEDELTWEELQAESGSPGPLQEFTTVSRRLRRIGRFEISQAQRAIIWNRPTRIAINFIDYINASNESAREWNQLTLAAQKFVRRLTHMSGVDQVYIGVGPKLEQTITLQAPEFEDGLVNATQMRWIEAMVNDYGR